MHTSLAKEAGVAQEKPIYLQNQTKITKERSILPRLQNQYNIGKKPAKQQGTHLANPIFFKKDNVNCPQKGKNCKTGEKGVCSTGIWTCYKNKQYCQRVSGPSYEKCDNLDNNCDGKIDEGCHLTTR